MAQPRDKKGRYASTGGGLIAALAAVAAGGGLGTGVGSAGSANTVGSGVRAQGAQNSSSARGRARDRSTAPTITRLARRELRARERRTHRGSVGRHARHRPVIPVAAAHRPQRHRQRHRTVARAWRPTFSGVHYRSVLDGNTVVNIQAEPVGRAQAALALAALASDTAI